MADHTGGVMLILHQIRETDCRQQQTIDASRSTNMLRDDLAIDELWLAIKARKTSVQWQVFLYSNAEDLAKRTHLESSLVAKEKARLPGHMK